VGESVPGERGWPGWARRGVRGVGKAAFGKNIYILAEMLSKLRFYGSSTLSTLPID
jgi:hypothetical protein